MDVSARRRLGIIGAVSLVTLAVLSRLIWLCRTYAVNVLFWDQWDIGKPQFDGLGFFAAFRQQHGPHRQGLGAWLLMAVNDLSGWDSEIEAYVAVGLMAGATLLALWLIVRLRGELSVFDAAVPLLFLTVHAFELYVGTINFSHGPLPVLLVLSFVLALTMTNEPARLVLMCAISFCAIYTGFGIFLGLVAPALIAAQLWGARKEPGRRGRLAVALGVMLASLGSFRIGWLNKPAVECFRFPAENPPDYLRFMGRLAARAMGGTGSGGIRVQVGIALTLALAATCVWALWRLVRAKGTDNRFAAIFVLTGFAVAYEAGTAVGRVCLGVDAAESSRYVVYSAVGFFGLYLTLRDVPLPSRLRIPLLAAVVVFLGAKEFTSHDATFDGIEWYARIKRTWVACYLAKEDFEQCNAEATFPIHPDLDGSRIREKMAFLKEHGYSLYKRR